MTIDEIEIPFEQDRGRLYRFFEILPGLLSLTLFMTPIVLSIYYIRAAVFFIIIYMLILLARASAMSVRVIEGYGKIKQARKIDWEALLHNFQDPKLAAQKYEKTKVRMLKDHRQNMLRLSQKEALDILPEDLIHVVVIATYNESQDIIHPTIDSVISTAGFEKRKTAFFLAYEERASDQKKRETLETLKIYKDKFYYAEAVEHKVELGEIPGKGANATLTARRIVKWAETEKIDPAKVVVTVLDADNRPDVNFFSILSYVYVSAENRKHKSFQPPALYNNNIWDVPAIMRICAISNTYFHMGNSMRPHALRNFSAHSQGLDALIETDFWSVRTIVEDGHQFWRSYFRFDGDHQVLPLYAPIYQDAVFSGGRINSARSQFKQIRRWTYGASDVAYVATRAFFIKNNVPKLDAFFKFCRLLESHVGWAVSAPLLLLSGWIPLVVNGNSSRSYEAQLLPQVVSNINTIALIALLFVVYVGISTLPKRPEHHKRTRAFGFVWQWILTPVVGVLFNSVAAINSQAHLAFGRYIGVFEVTDKAVKNK